MPYFSADTVYEKNGIGIASQTVMEKKDGESILLLEVVNTTDGMIGVSTTNIDINDLRVCDSTWSYDSINPGKTAIVDVALCSVLEQEYWEVYGISGADHIALRAVFKDSDGNEAADHADLSIDISGTDASFSREGTEIYNGNGIRIVSKGVYADPSEYSDDLHILLFAENTSGQTLSLQDVYGSLSINDYMAAYSFCTTTMEDGSCAMIDITLWGYGLEDINISEPFEVQNVGFSLSVRDQNYKELDQVSIGFAVE